MPKYQLPMLNLLIAFEAAARHHSMNKASQELHLTHAAVSQQIRKLEEQLGLLVFERLSSGVALTEAGETLLGAVRTGFYHIERAVMQLRRRETPQSLVLSVDRDFAGLWLVPRLAELQALMPNTIVEIIAVKSAPLPAEPSVHCSIRYAEAGLKSGNAEMLFRSRLFPVCAESLARTLPLKSPDDLRHHVLLHDRSMVEWEHYLQYCTGKTDVDVTAGIVFSENSLCLEAAARGQGVAIGDDFLAATHLAERRLIRPFGSPLLSKNAYYLFIPESASKNPSVNAFRAWLLRSIESQRSALNIT
ncbi:MAG: gcvA [Gammaproteobacteria bacterium]|nr:gcvA [Gammaproteobacteria bacterium]